MYMLSPVRLSVVCNVYAPYSVGLNFWQFVYVIWYLGHLLTFTENFTEIVLRNPSVGGWLNARGVAKFSDFWRFEGGWQSHNYGQFTITMSSSKRLQRDRVTPTV